MNKQMTKREEEIVAMDFGFMDNHGFTSVAGSDYDSRFGYCRVYESEAMAVLDLRLVVITLGISRTYDAWHIQYYCYIADNYGFIQERFSLYSLARSEEYYKAWKAWHYEGGWRDWGVHDMLFSQLDEEKLYEECMERVERLGEEEQEYIREKYAH